MSEYRQDSMDASNDDEVIGLYDRELHLNMLHNTELYNAEQRGIEQGEKQAKIETAKNLLRNGVSKEIIIKSTGLSEEEVDQLG